MFTFCLTSATEIEFSKDEKIEKCIEGMKAGNKESLSSFYDLCKAPVYGFALSILKNKADAEDILQDAILKMYNSAPLYKMNGRPMPWILEITKNLALMKIRKNSRMDYNELSWDSIEFSFSDDSTEDRVILQDALSILSDEERQIVLLHALSGLKHRETGKLLNMPLSTVLSKYNRAIKKMKTHIERG